MFFLSVGSDSIYSPMVHHSDFQMILPALSPNDYHDQQPWQYKMNVFPPLRRWCDRSIDNNVDAFPHPNLVAFIFFVVDHAIVCLLSHDDFVAGYDKSVMTISLRGI
jgi:hypothetical protein